MPKALKNEIVRCRYFEWRISQRNGVYTADGRSNQPTLGRYSLRTCDRDEALRELEQLDLTMAVQFGLADSKLLNTESSKILPWDAGRKLYETHAKRPRVAGGPKPSTSQRYKAVFDKFIAFAQDEGYRTWNELNRQVMDGYAGWLDGEGYEYATEYLELTTLKQVMNFLIENGHLPSSTAFKYPLRKADGTDTYCWQAQEVEAIVSFCNSTELKWLQHVVIALAATGVRISELSALRWSDVDLARGMISLTDETSHKARNGKEKRTTKSGRSRAFPIHDSLRSVLNELPRNVDGRLFHGPLDGRIKADTVRRILIRDVLTPLASQFPTPVGEVGFADGRLHSFRHYFCSNCANSGVTERVLMKWLGHRNSRMVHRYYHLHDEESIRQMSQVKLY